MLKDLFKKKKTTKIMENKMAINTYISTIESKKQTNKQEEQRQNHGYRGHFDGCKRGDGTGEWVKR